MEPLPECRLPGIRMRSGITELIAVGRTPAEEAPFDPRLGGHRTANSNLDSVPLALAHAAVEGHDQVVRVRFGIDPAPDLRDPQVDAVVDQDSKGESELAAVEGPGGLANDDGLESPTRVLDRLEKCRRLGPALPR